MLQGIETWPVIEANVMKLERNDAKNRFCNVKLLDRISTVEPGDILKANTMSEVFREDITMI